MMYGWGRREPAPRQEPPDEPRPGDDQEEMARAAYLRMNGFDGYAISRLLFLRWLDERHPRMLR